MITLVQGKTNRVRLEVSSSVDIGGFSAYLAACPSLKSIPDITKKNIFFEFSAEDLDSVARQPYVGTLIVCDADGKKYLEFAICFRVIAIESPAAVISNQMLCLTIVSTRGTEGGSGGGDTPSGDYVTRGELTAAVSECTGYTDEKIGDIGDVIIKNEKIDVDTPSGPSTITLQQVAQQAVGLYEDIESIKSTTTVAHIEDKDEDGQPDEETLYLTHGEKE